MTVPSASERRIRALEARVRRLAAERRAGRPAGEGLEAAVAALAAELDRYTELGERRPDDDYPRDAASITG